MIFKGRKLINDHHIEVKGHPALFYEPLYILPIDDVDIGLAQERRFAFCFTADHHRIIKAVEMIPLLQLRTPGITSHSQRRNHQHPVYLKAVEQQVAYGSEGDACFAKTHIKQHCGEGMRLDVVDGIFLVFMRFVFHPLSLQSAPGHQGHTP